MKLLILIILIILIIYANCLLYVGITKKPIDFQFYVIDNIVFVFHMDEEKMVIGFYSI